MTQDECIKVLRRLFVGKDASARALEKSHGAHFQREAPRVKEEAAALCFAIGALGGTIPGGVKEQWTKNGGHESWDCECPSHIESRQDGLHRIERPKEKP